MDGRILPPRSLSRVLYSMAHLQVTPDAARNEQGIYYRNVNSRKVRRPDNPAVAVVRALPRKPFLLLFLLFFFPPPAKERTHFGGGPWPFAGSWSGEVDSHSAGRGLFCPIRKGSRRTSFLGEIKGEWDIACGFRGKRYCTCYRVCANGCVAAEIGKDI